MIQIAGKPFQLTNQWPTGGIERVIIEHMLEDPVVYDYQTSGELRFEILLRRHIIRSARAMNQSQVQFAPFSRSRCNPQYWILTTAGGFQLRPDVTPAEAIRDIYRNSSLYAFECAMGKMIIYYHALLNSIDEDVFNQLFQDLYLYSWHSDPDIRLEFIYTNHFIPGDVVYFNNPDFNPQTPWWRGENAVVLGDGTYFGHGLGINTAEAIIQALNESRRPGSNQSAYLTHLVGRPSFKHLARISNMPRHYKKPHIIIHHDETSISCSRYSLYLNQACNTIR